MDLTEIIVKSSETTKTLHECKAEGNSTLECAKDVVKDTAKDYIVDKLKEHSKIVGPIVNTIDAKEYIENCRKDHDMLSCVAGATVKYGITTATEHMSKALIISSPISPLPLANIVVGTTGLIKSDQIGKDFGKVAVELVDYLVDHVPSQFIDTSKSLTLQNDQTIIEFVPHELKFIKGLVKTNQDVNHVIQKLQTTSENIMDDMEVYRQRTQETQIHFNEKTNEVQIKLDSSARMIKTLDQLDLVHSKLPHIHAEGLAEKIRYNYVEKAEQAQRHNQNPNRSTTANVSYDGDDWKIGFTINYSCGGGYGGRGGGGFSCVLL